MLVRGGSTWSRLWSCCADFQTRPMSNPMILVNVGRVEFFVWMWDMAMEMRLIETGPGVPV